MLPLHATEETLEHYALGLLEGGSLESFEEHLLTCEQCSRRVTEADQRIALMRKALTEVEYSRWLEEKRHPGSKVKVMPKVNGQSAGN